MTLFGKLVQHCLLLFPGADQDVVHTLLDMLKQHEVGDFAYDVQYITGNVNNMRQQQRPPVVRMRRTYGSGQDQLHHTAYAVAFDPGVRCVFAAARDGDLAGWQVDTGNFKDRVKLKDRYACTLACRDGLLVAAAVKQSPSLNVPPALLAWRPSRYGLDPAGLLLLPSLLVTTIALLGDARVVAAEFGADRRPSITEFDYSRGMESAVPVQTYEGHAEIVTALAPVEGPAGGTPLFVSGGKDCAVRLWDRRVCGAVATLGVCDQAVLSLAACDAHAACASADNYTRLWDLRCLSGGDLSAETPLVVRHRPAHQVRRIALMPGVLLMATKGKGLLQLEWERQPLVAVPVGGDPDGAASYHDVAWARGERLLFAAGDDGAVDGYDVEVC